MALVLERYEPLIGTTGGIAEAVPWRVTEEREAVLMPRGYGREY